MVSNDKSSSSNKTKPVSSQELEDLTDDIKQSFIRDYKTCYSEQLIITITINEKGCNRFRSFKR
ncbi:MAG: hypothetical protein ACJ71O_18960 [Nitrososphaeraceae archaeon]